MPSLSLRLLTRCSALWAPPPLSARITCRGVTRPVAAPSLIFPVGVGSQGGSCQACRPLTASAAICHMPVDLCPPPTERRISCVISRGETLPHGCRILCRSKMRRTRSTGGEGLWRAWPNCGPGAICGLLNFFSFFNKELNNAELQIQIVCWNCFFVHFQLT